MPLQHTSLNVSPTPELERFVSAYVALGRYQTASEVGRAGLRLLIERDQAGKPSASKPERDKKRRHG